ncbi:hypothetical protein [Nonomuraea guangzhouensis]|uniref:Uncharacterized protein n=1 Tax=Nonomuraea guangzhouensis TaxID=1291555 RepID=A0ABW4GKV7_9ACTN|nr:hypothetical protein [Nonomuraea guangzhouensis]
MTRHVPISGSVAAEHDQALDRLRVLLTRRGIHSYVVEWLRLTLRSAPFPAAPLSNLDRYPPELIVFAPQGWRVATVRIAADRSAAYIVEVARVGEDHALMPDIRYIVPSGKPAKAAALIPG